MRRFASILLVALLVAAGIILFRGQSYAAIGNLDIYEGSAEILAEGTAQEARTGSPVHRTDTIRVAPGSRVAVILRDGSVFRLEGGTEVRIDDVLFRRATLQQASMDIEQGKVWWNTQPLLPGATVEVETPTLVATVRGTSFHTAYVRRVSEVYVSTHTVAASLQSDPRQVQTLTAGMMLRVRDDAVERDFRTGPSVLRQEDKDDWILFNEREDRLLAAKRGQPLPSSSSIASSTSSPSSASSISLVTRSAAPPPPASRATSSAAADVAAPRASSSSASSREETHSRSSSRRTIISSVPSSSRSPTLTRLVLTADRTEMGIGERANLYVTAFYADGSRGNYHDVTWTIDPASRGTISKSGVFQANSAGDATIIARHGDMQSNALTLTVRAAQRRVDSLTIRYTKHPPSDGSNFRLPTATFSALANYSDGATADVTQQASWTVSGTAKGTITQSGEYRPSSEGTDTVTATFEQVSGSATITIP